MTRSAKARFGQVGDQVRKVKDQVGQGQGQELDNSVCPHPLLQFLQFFQFMSDRLRQVTPGYIMLSQFTSEGRDVELDNLIK